MSKNLVIVESPSKAKTIEGYLGKDYIVKSSAGHIRDLPEKGLGIDLENKFEPTYKVSADKVKVVNDLKKEAKDKVVWLATDDDREGEAISWHLKEALGLKDDTKRIVFREITKRAINAAIESPRTIDMDLVNAQQARRILDRLVGFQLSPVLWKKIRAVDSKGLSAGRVQSVAVRIIVEREREIENFTVSSSYKIQASFNVGNNKVLSAELAKNIEGSEESANKFLTDCIPANYTVVDLEVKPAVKSPSAPFTTSTLQQEASRKLGLSVQQTMSLAQKLYEAGKISYMRTDSTSLSQEAIENAKNVISAKYGDAFSKSRNFKTKDKAAQEAHEAIRPTDFAVENAGADRNEKRLYDLIWKRTIASQMADAKLERTIAKINISTRPEELVATGEVLKFEGFLKVYLESTDDEDEENKGMLPPITKGQKLDLLEMRGTQRFTRPAARYSEASLVKKMEELGIGRPSTYAPTISTIIRREYIVKEDRAGFTREFKELTLKDGHVSAVLKTENYGTEKAKLFPTNLGMIVNDYLVENFETVLNYKFTAKIEDDFDLVAEGKETWQNMIDQFYQDFHAKIEQAEGEKANYKNSYELGIEPTSGKKLFAKVGKFGPYLQLGESTDEEKPTFTSLKKGTLISSVTLEEALQVFSGPKLPLELGLYEGNPLVVNEGRYGPYVLHNGKFYNLDKGEDPLTVTKERAIAVIEAKLASGAGDFPREMAAVDGQAVTINKGRFGPYIKFGAQNINIPKGENPGTIDDARVAEIIAGAKDAAAKKIIKEYAENPNVKVLNGRYGPYIQIGKRNVKIPKDQEPAALTLEDCLKLGEA